ncbi:MAG: DUF58 domain-containing protein [Phycisphaerae bacterium]|nr:DUF58 domain-containing protein [Phycisphaerae bacterium]
MASLFTEDFVRSIERLRITARQVLAGGRHAQHRSRDLGAGMEFRDFRSYVPGDDLRRIDWSLYRRSGRLFLRLFEEPEDLPVYILVDISDSMFFETPPRADGGRQMAGVLAAVSLNQFDRIRLYPFGADLVQPAVSLSGKHRLRHALEFLDGLAPAGPTDLVKSIRRFGTLRLRSGLVVVISDFFDPQGVEAVIGALGSLRHRLLVVQLVRDSDARPPVDGELRLIDCESGAEVDVTVTGKELDRYAQAYRAFSARLAESLLQQRAAHLRLNADRPVLDQLSDLFAGGVLVT